MGGPEKSEKMMKKGQKGPFWGFFDQNYNVKNHKNQKSRFLGVFWGFFGRFKKTEKRG